MTSKPTPTMESMRDLSPKNRNAALVSWLNDLTAVYEKTVAQRDALLAAVREIDKGFADGSIKWARRRQADSDPYHPANTAMCAALDLVRERADDR